MSVVVHHPHDSFFRATLSNLEVAKDLLQAHLAPELVEQIDWNSLQLTNKSYIDEQLSQFHSDMVYSCVLNGQNTYIYLLIEQQTEPEPLLPLRLLEYNVKMCREHINQGNKKLPLVVNLVLYSGKKTPYPYSIDIYDCFEAPDKARAMMFKPLALIDLGQLSEEELSKHGSADMLELLLKQGQKRTFYKWLEEHPELVLALFERVYGYSGIVYILDQEKKYPGNDLVKKLKSISPSKEKDIMQAVRTIRQESMQQGMQQGMQARNLEIVERMLRLHLDVDTIQQATGLLKEEVLQLKKKLGL